MSQYPQQPQDPYGPINWGRPLGNGYAQGKPSSEAIAHMLKLQEKHMQAHFDAMNRAASIAAKIARSAKPLEQPTKPAKPIHELAHHDFECWLRTQMDDIP